VPLPLAVRNGTAEITERDYIVLRVRSEDGSEGVSCALARGDYLLDFIERTFGPIALGRASHEPARVNRDMWSAATPFLGTDGQVARAISLVDIALWDLHARVLDAPMADLLGASGIHSVPALAASGYYQSSDTGKELQAVQEEYEQLAASGFQRFKIMVGAVDPTIDAERIQMASDAAGSPVAIDVNGAWDTPAHGERLLGLLSLNRIEFVEEPFRNHAWKSLRRFRNVNTVPIAIGEWESDVRQVEWLLAEQLIDVARLDVTAIGGVTGWMKAAALAETHEIAILPHYFPHFHAPLAAAASSSPAVEVIPASSGAENMDLLMKNAPEVHEGQFPLSEGVGFGISWDWDRIESGTRRAVSV
jgi:L-alanine-DL-glutamate epimerase-like enolase superfamily enzyme